MIGGLVFPADAAAVLAAAEARVAAIAGPLERLAVGWATVDLDRATRTALGTAAEDEAGQARIDDRDAPDVRDLATDELLGARCRYVRALAVDGTSEAVVLLEPSTEGRLAATLARFGEGPAVLYVTVPPDGLERLGRAGGAQPVVSRPAGGPFGRSVLVLGGPMHGPHLVVADGHWVPSSP